MDSPSALKRKPLNNQGIMSNERASKDIEVNIQVANGDGLGWTGKLVPQTLLKN